MRNFERVGCEWQDSALNIYQAIKSFQRSCEICSNRGYSIDCNRCAIQAAHRRKVEVLRFLNEERIAKARQAERVASMNPIRPVRITIVV